MGLEGSSGNGPILSLRMSAASMASAKSTFSQEEALDSVVVLGLQDETYKCRDYIGRRRKRVGQDMDISDQESTMQIEDMVDEVCREKMCEWSYRVCDHFQTSREIVAFTFSFLDRFIDRCSCDRTAFKLAAMTALYMATKLLNAKQLSIRSLAELSRGEFEMAHIAEMERIILDTLEWKVNPPTVQSYITTLRPLLGNMGSLSTVNEICDRATFFAELCVYDYQFVTEGRLLVATACFLNAIESMENVNIVNDLKRGFFSVLQSDGVTTLDMLLVEKAQTRLWYLYSCSAQLQYDDADKVQIAQERLVKYNFGVQHAAVAHSPVSVNPQGQF
jgi:Cyclin, N-terminal domain